MTAIEQIRAKSDSNASSPSSTPLSAATEELGPDADLHSPYGLQALDPSSHASMKIMDASVLHCLAE